MSKPEKKNELADGTLYLVATPIGNMGDIGSRAIDTLSGVDFILCEDTRKSGLLLKKIGVKAKLVSYEKFSESKKLDGILQKLEDGENCALISSGGSPLASDPGYLLVKACIERGIGVTSVPGATAYTTALSLSGFFEEGFHFAGWLPRKGKAREEKIRTISGIPEPVVIYESPERVQKTLADLAKTQPDRAAVVARELTKLHEEILRGSCSTLAEEVSSRKLKGECVIVLGPSETASNFDRAKTDMVYNYFSLLTREGIADGRAAKLAAKLLGLPAKEVYRLLMVPDEVD